MKIKAENARHFVNHLDTLKIYLSTFQELQGLERRANRNMITLCNGTTEANERLIEKSNEKILKQVKKLVPAFADSIFLNHDPRGYSLKIRTEAVISGVYTDWGGYGVVAPEF